MPVDQSVSGLVVRSVGRSIDLSVGQSINQSVRVVVRSVSQSVTRLVCRLSSQLVWRFDSGRSVSHSVKSVGLSVTYSALVIYHCLHLTEYFQTTYMKKRYLALPVSENHENCVEKLDILRHVIHPDSMGCNRIFFPTKERVRPVPCKSKDK